MRTLIVSCALITGAALLTPAAVATAGTTGAGPLATAFNNTGITSSGTASAGNLDGTGDSFSSADLTADGLTPGARLPHDGLELTWPDVQPGQPDNVLANGQTIALAGEGNTLGIVATSTGGDTSGTVTVTYTDGTSSTATINVANWTDTAAATTGTGSADLIATMAGWNAATGQSGTLPVSLSYLSIPIDPSKTVADVTLPAVGTATGHTTPAMHVFDLTVGAVATSAADGPGDESYYDEGRKDCVGTAANDNSKVWYTVADGMLSDVYYPTIDNTNVKSLEYIVTDGSSFTDIQPRDMTYTVSSLAAAGQACQVTATAKSGAYRLVTDYFTNPGSDAVVTRVTYQPLTRAAQSYHVYARLQYLLNGHGGGGSQNAGGGSVLVDRGIPVGYSTNSFTEAVNRSYATPSYLALAASSPFTAIDNGFAGQPSDGLTQLSDNHAITTPYADASDGDVTTTVGLPVDSGPVVMALGFGSDEQAAVTAATTTARTPSGAMLGSFTNQWQRYDATLRQPPARYASAYWTGANVLKASLDKTFTGAVAASLASPWGQAVPAGNAVNGLATYFGSYRETFSRDAYEAFTGLLTEGDLTDARAITRFLFDRQQLASGAFPRNSLPNGKAAPDTGGLQLDETSYPILMAWQSGLATDRELYVDHVKPAAEFLVANGPSDGVERWEEQTGYSPSTIAAEIAGLVAAGAIARANGDDASARVFDATADEFQRAVIGWTVTTTGPDSSQPYFIRVSKTGDPNDAISYNLGNGGPTLDQRSVIDQGFLELTRLGELSQTLPVITNSLNVVDNTIASSTPSGTGYHRYNDDGYGDAAGTGEPWATTDTGTGGLWPTLSGERAEHDLAVGDLSGATSALDFMLNSANGTGLIPEQVWDGPDLAASPYGSDPTTASIGFTDGKADGSATPLTWATAQETRLILDLGAGKLLEQPSIVSQRYLAHPPGTAPLTLTSDPATVSGSTVTVAGVTTPGATVDIETTDVSYPDGTATVTTVTAGSDGSFSATVTIAAGDESSVAVAVTAGNSTAESSFDVTSTAVPGTLLYSDTGATGGGNGPGNFALPTDSAFTAGSFTITDFRVARGATMTSFQIGVASLTNPFGGQDGFSLQLADLYLSQPGLPSYDYSTAATYPSRNYTVSPGWSQSIEVDGFGTAQWQTALGTSAGTIAAVSGNTADGQITITVPTASLGSFGSGWSVAVALFGQDGYGTDDARAFTATPEAYTFGVCAAASSAQVCQVSPSIEPEVMDTIAVPGVSIGSELNLLNYPGNTTTQLTTPVLLQGATVP
ncbi:MAG: glucodextranase DOMON-like domain-containing protein [Streptosporangiaceae bacterium]